MKFSRLFSLSLLSSISIVGSFVLANSVKAQDLPFAQLQDTWDQSSFGMPASPAGYTYMIRSGLVNGAQKCGFEVLDGRDNRLPSSVLSRNVQEVLARVKENGKIEVHVLIDTTAESNGQNDRFATQFLKRNGGRIMEIESDTEFEDISVQADIGGRLAYTTSSRKNHQIETVWRVRGPSGGMKRVTESDFSQYLKEKVVAVYVDRVCKNKYRL